MIKIPQKTSGVTLIEVVISFAIMSILTSVLYGLSINSVKTTKSSEIKQKASLLAQGIIEDFKSDDVIKKNTGTGLNLSNGMKLAGTDNDYAVNNYDLGKGYKANITVKKNDANIGSGQASNQDTSSYYCYTVNLKKTSLNSISMSDDDLKTTTIDNLEWNDAIITDSSSKVIIKVEVNETSKDKTINVSLPGGNTFSKTFTFNAGNESADKGKEILLSINCENYNLPEDKRSEDNGFQVDVYNQGKVPVNICLQKTNSISGTAEAKTGDIKFANNRSSSEGISNGDLYDINIEVRNDSAKDEILFKSVISQNLKIEQSGLKNP